MSAPNQPLDSTRRALLPQERGRQFLPAENRLLLGYPGTYREAMSSLGYLSVLRQIDETPGWCAERAFLGGEDPGPLRSLETDRLVSEYPFVALSVAYEIQLFQVVSFLRQSGLSALPESRREQKKQGKGRAKAQPLILAGGPLTRINPRPLGAFVDLCLVGDSEESLPKLLELLQQTSNVEDILEEAARWQGFYVPSRHGNNVPKPLRAPAETLPAKATLWTPHAEFGEMFLIEACRGCSMRCHFCATRRSLSGGARFVSLEKIVKSIPDEAKRVGLVGAEVGHHPQLGDIVEALLEKGLGVGLSSLRADRLDERIVNGLLQGGLKTLTIAADGASERIRKSLQKGVNEHHLKKAATLASDAGIKKLKVYQLVGVPEETDEDWEEMARLALELAEKLPIELSFSCLVPKPQTPLEKAPVAKASIIKRRMRNLKRQTRGKIRIKEPALRWVGVEWLLSHGTLESGRRLLATMDAGGGISALKNNLAKAMDS